MKRFRVALSIIVFLVLIINGNVIISSARVKERVLSLDRINTESFAMTDVNEIKEMYSNVICAENVQLSQFQQEECVKAFIENDNGELSLLNCDVNLKRIVIDDNYKSQVMGLLGSDHNSEYTEIYILSGTTKESSGTNTSHGVTLNGWITWIDNPGIDNTFVSASGSRSGSWSIGNFGYYDIQNASIPLGSGTFYSSFTSYGNSNSNTGLEFRLHIHTMSQDNHNIQLTVTTSIFD